ncbi:MAG TPA: thermonuclease family protein [Rhizomicrobium sp.]|nr:thermonuclease family protein [Rhizomicrobium sp.]
MRRQWAGVFAAGLVVLPLRAQAVAPCAGPVEARDVHVLRVEKNADLVLTDGRAVRLEGVMLPAGDRDHAPNYLAERALGSLNELARNRALSLAVFVPKEDRYGRLRAQVFFPDVRDEPWLQVALLKRGFARVSIAPDRRECASELYAAEAYARRKHYGIWASGFYDVRTPADLGGTIGTFQIVEGKVLSARVKDGRAYLDFGRDWRRDFKATISPADMRRFRDAGVDPRTYEGLTIRVRGFVDALGGPEIEVASPEAIEVVQGPS